MDPLLPGWLAPTLAGLFGAAVGSFANVVIHRVPQGMSIVRPASRCPGCGASLAWYDNIPLVSYLILRGRCRTCGSPIGIRYPLVEAANAFLWAAVTLALGVVPHLPMFLAFFTVLLVLSVIDLDTKRIPNKVLWPASLSAGLLAASAAVVSGSGVRFPSSTAGVLLYGGGLLAVALLAPGGMGGGDIKLAAYIGWHLGWIGLGRIAVGAFAAVLFGGVVGIALLAAGRRGRKDALPFGPFMALGAATAFFFGNHLLEAWLG